MSDENNNKRLVGEYYRRSGSLSTKVEFYKKKDSFGNSCCWVRVPKWVLIVATIAALFILVLLAVAVLIATVFPRPGLLAESCVGRSCLSGSGMKCLNGTCQCLANQYYATKCIDKKGFNERCSSTVPCKDNSTLACLNGMCQCGSNQYWYKNVCVNKGNYKQPCKNDDQCLSTLMLTCETKTRTCLCNSTR